MAVRIPKDTPHRITQKKLPTAPVKWQSFHLSFRVFSTWYAAKLGARSNLQTDQWMWEFDIKASLVGERMTLFSRRIRWLSSQRKQWWREGDQLLQGCSPHTARPASRPVVLVSRKPSERELVFLLGWNWPFSSLSVNIIFGLNCDSLLRVTAWEGKTLISPQLRSSNQCCVIGRGMPIVELRAK